MKQSIPDIINSLESGIKLYRNSSAAFRIAVLNQLEKVILREKNNIVKALQADFNKPEIETLYTEIYVTLNEIRYAKKHLKLWMSPVKSGFKLSAFGSGFYSYPESKGIVLIISTWNYPFNLGLIPLVNAVAAGNVVLLKPSEFSAESAVLIAKIVHEVFKENHARVICGGADTGAELLEHRYNHIMFTGSQKVARIVLRKAAEFCTPVTLELGGKNPAIVFEDADVKAAVKRIIWGKWMNGGQTCIGVDTIFVHEKISNQFVKELQSQIDSSEVNKHIAAMIHRQAYEKQTEYLEDALNSGASLSISGQNDSSSRKFGPVVLQDISESMKISKQEIFGPLLPIRSFKRIEELTEVVAGTGDPLCVYIFTSSKKNQEYVLRNIPCGAVGINEVIGQFFHPALPFGGVNQSGMGKSHGKWGFDEFSNYKAVIKNQFSWNWLMLAKMPYSDFKKKIANIVLRWF